MQLDRHTGIGDALLSHQESWGGIGYVPRLHIVDRKGWDLPRIWYFIVSDLLKLCKHCRQRVFAKVMHELGHMSHCYKPSTLHLQPKCAQTLWVKTTERRIWFVANNPHCFELLVRDAAALLVTQQGFIIQLKLGPTFGKKSSPCSAGLRLRCTWRLLEEEVWNEGRKWSSNSMPNAECRIQIIKLKKHII